jgi:hypothetical protein
LANWKIKMKNAGPKKKTGRKPKQKNALAKANAERKAAALKKKTENKLLLPSVAQWLLQSPLFQGVRGHLPGPPGHQPTKLRYIL